MQTENDNGKQPDLVNAKEEKPSENEPGWYSVIADNLYNKNLECEAWWTGTFWAIRDFCEVKFWKRKRPYPLSNYQKKLIQLNK